MVGCSMAAILRLSVVVYSGVNLGRVYESSRQCRIIKKFGSWIGRAARSEVFLIARAAIHSFLGQKPASCFAPLLSALHPCHASPKPVARMRVRASTNVKQYLRFAAITTKR
jgi:hypothetical protein